MNNDAMDGIAKNQENVLHLHTSDGLKDEVHFQILSDLHLEYYDDKLPLDVITPVAPVLAMLGDIGYAQGDSPEGKKLIEFIRSMSSSFEIILYLAGNHEYWKSSYEGTNKWLSKNLDDAFDNVYLMHRRKITINGVSIIGATLWTDIPVEKTDGTFHGMSASHEQFWRMRDFENISELSYDNDHGSWPCVEYAAYWDREEQLQLEEKINNSLFCYHSWFERDVEWLQEQLDRIQKDGKKDVIVVLTHHAPTGQGTVAPINEEDGLGLAYTELSSIFANITEKKCVWFFGHTHWNCDRMANDHVRIVSNAVGYPGSGTDPVKSCDGYIPYDPVKTIKVSAGNEERN